LKLISGRLTLVMQPGGEHEISSAWALKILASWRVSQQNTEEIFFSAVDSQNISSLFSNTYGFKAYFPPLPSANFGSWTAQQSQVNPPDRATQ
jgi:hypothetical protein